MCYTIRRQLAVSAWLAAREAKEFNFKQKKFKLHFFMLALWTSASWQLLFAKNRGR